MGVQLSNYHIKARCGSYAGNDAANRAIPHGLGAVPRLVIISVDEKMFTIGGSNSDQIAQVATALHAVTAMTSTNFYVGNIASYGQSANGAGSTYDWLAIID